MANPSGKNQFGGFGSEPAYGEAQRQTQLARGAPMSGAPIATAATETPRRAKRRAQRGAAPAEQNPTPPAPLPPAVNPQAEVDAIWAALAAEPEASDLIRQYARGPV